MWQELAGLWIVIIVTAIVGTIGGVCRRAVIPVGRPISGAAVCFSLEGAAGGLSDEIAP